MLTKSNLILDPFILPEIKHISKIRDCDILNSDKLSEPEISQAYTWPIPVT